MASIVSSLSVQSRQVSREASRNASLLQSRQFRVNKERTKAIHEDDPEEDRREREEEREEAAKRVLSRHLIIAFKHKTLVRNRPNFKETKIEPRNFAIVLLQQLETRIDQVKEEMTSRPTWRLSEFNAMLGLHVKAALAEEATIQEQRETDEYFRNVTRRIKLNRSNHNLLQSSLSTTSLLTDLPSEALELIAENSMLESKGFNSTSWYWQSPQNTEAGLAELFRAIDHHNTGVISWEKFISYCMEATMLGRVGIDYDEAIANYQPAYLEETRDLKGIRKLRWCPDIERILACGNSHTLRVIDPVTWLPMKNSFQGSGQLLDAEYIPDTDQIVTTSSDLTVRFFDYQRPKRCKVIETGFSQLCVKWSKRWGKLYTGGRTGELLCWNCNGRDQSSLWWDPVVSHKTRPHTAPVTDMLFLPVDGSLVTCSLDTTICVQEPKHGQMVQRFIGHKAGILCIAYATDYNFLISAGIEVDPQLWITSVSTNTKPFTLRDGDHPHANPVCGVRWIPSSPQVVTLDVKGMMKIWDVRTFECVQTIVCSKGRDSGRSLWHTLEYVTSDSQIACGATRRAYVYEYNFSSAMGNATAHDEPVAAAVYNSHNKTFATAAGRGVRIWNALTGELSCIYANLAEAEITAMCLDTDGRKFFIGTHQGHVIAFNYSSGSVARNYGLVHNGEVTGLCFCKDRCAVISSSWDGHVCFIHDTPKGEFVVMNKSGSIDGRCCAYSFISNIMLVGDAKNFVTVWDMAYSKGNAFKCATQPVALLSRDAEVLSIATFDDYAAFVCGDSTGNLYMYNLRPAMFPYSLLATWKNGASDHRLGCPTALVFHSVRRWLYVADDAGFIQAYRLTDILDLYCLETQTDGFRRKTVASLQRMLHVPAPDPSRFSVFEYQMTRWRAHTDAVSSIELLPHSNAILSAGFDRKIQIFTCDGVLRGVLDQQGLSFSNYSLRLTEPSEVDMVQHGMETEEDLDDDEEELVTSFSTGLTPKAKRNESVLAMALSQFKLGRQRTLDSPSAMSVDSSVDKDFADGAKSASPVSSPAALPPPILSRASTPMLPNLRRAMSFKVSFLTEVQEENEAHMNTNKEKLEPILPSVTTQLPEQKHMNTNLETPPPSVPPLDPVEFSEDEDEDIRSGSFRIPSKAKRRIGMPRSPMKGEPQRSSPVAVPLDERAKRGGLLVKHEEETQRRRRNLNNSLAQYLLDEDEKKIQATGPSLKQRATSTVFRDRATRRSHSVPLRPVESSRSDLPPPLDPLPIQGASKANGPGSCMLLPSRVMAPKSLLAPTVSHWRPTSPLALETLLFTDDWKKKAKQKQ